MSYCPPTVIFGFAADTVASVLTELFGETVHWEKSKADFFAYADDDAFCRKYHFHDLGLKTESGLEQILTASQKGPIFYYHTDHVIEIEFEDVEALETYEHQFSGWGYRIFHKGAEIATAEFNANWPSYGDELEQSLKQVAQSANPDALSLFGIPSENIERLKQLLNPDTIYDLFFNELEEDIREKIVACLTLDEFYPHGAYPT